MAAQPHYLLCCLQVGPGVLGYGSGGTVVFAGELDGRPVAVKRMLRQFYEMARKEIDALILADEHPSIVRCTSLFAVGKRALSDCYAIHNLRCQLLNIHG